MLRPLAFDTSTFNVPQGITENIESCIKRGLPELLPAICSHDGTFVIAGSGPSLADQLDEIRAEKEKGRPICAVKAAHDFLLSHDIEPDLFLSIDPRDRRSNVQRASENTVYLLSSRCCPQLFDHLKDRYVMVFHAASSQEENDCLQKHGVKFAIGGTSTSGLRAVNVGHFMGYRKFVMYGMDSCNAPDGITKRVDGSLTGQTTDVIVGASGKKFIANVAMAQQAIDFQQLWVMLPGINVEVKGNGLLAAILEERKRLGMPT